MVRAKAKLGKRVAGRSRFGELKSPVTGLFSWEPEADRGRGRPADAPALRTVALSDANANRSRPLADHVWEGMSRLRACAGMSLVRRLGQPTAGVQALQPYSSAWPDRFAYLGYQDEKTWKHEIILHRVPMATRSDSGAVDPSRRLDPASNRAHIDIDIDDVDVAIAQIEAIGGRLKYSPTVYPVPHAYESARPLIDWAVMRNPFGNEFRLVRELTRPEREALAVAAALPRTHTGVPSPAKHDTTAENSSQRLPLNDARVSLHWVAEATPSASFLAHLGLVEKQEIAVRQRAGMTLGA